MDNEVRYNEVHHIKGAGGGLHRNSLEIDFIVVSDRGEWYLSAAFGPMEKCCS